MEDFLLMFISLFGDLFTFLDSFIIFGSISFLKLFFILFLFSIALHFLVNNKRGD